VSLPGGLTTITVTGTFLTATGTGLGGSVSFTPTSAVTDAAGEVVLAELAVTAMVSGTTGVMTPLVLPTTDNQGTTPAGWAYTMAISVPGAQNTITPVYLPHALGSTVDITALSASLAAPAPSGVSYIPNAVTVPVAGPSGGGGFLYATGGALYWIGPNNTAHLIASP
jgi:hypothetical protein